MNRKNSKQDILLSDSNIKILKEALEEYTIQECQKQTYIKQYDFSDDFKRGINNIFKELGIEKIPHPEIK